MAPEHEGARATAATAVATKEREATVDRETPEREAATEVIPTIKRDAPTETIATSDEAAKTEVIPTHTDPKPAWPGSSATWSGPESDKD